MPSAETARLQDLRARIAEREEEIARLREREDKLQAERETVATEYAEALATYDDVLDADDLVEKLSLSELRQKVDDARTQRREASLADTEPAIQSGVGPTETARLSPDDRERVTELEALLEDLPDRDTGLIKHRRREIEEELAEIRGRRR
jgi:DNA repair exonuclease SbcCD ATPase subunit